MESRFTFEFYCPRWERNDTYLLDIHDEGWTVSHLAISGNCDRRGAPYLYANFDQDSIEYPSGLGFKMELLFEHARDHSLPDDEIQRRLGELARWVERVNAVEGPDF